MSSGVKKVEAAVLMAMIGLGVFAVRVAHLAVLVLIGLGALDRLFAFQVNSPTIGRITEWANTSFFELVALYLVIAVLAISSSLFHHARIVRVNATALGLIVKYLDISVGFREKGIISQQKSWDTEESVRSMWYGLIYDFVLRWIPVVGGLLREAHISDLYDEGVASRRESVVKLDSDIRRIVREELKGETRENDP